MEKRRTAEIEIANWLLLITLGSYLTGGVLASRVFDDFVWQIVVTQIFVLLPTAVYYLCVVKKGERAIRIREDLRLKPIRFRTLLLVAIEMLFLAPVLTFVNLVSQLLSNYVAAETIIGEISSEPFLVSFAVVAVLPAFTEELVYRGMLFGGYRRRSVFVGAVVSGLVFGMMHGNLNQLMYAFVMGVVFAFVDEVTGSTVSSMVMHLLVNGTSVTLVYVMAYLEKRPGEIGEMMSTAAEKTEKLGWGDLGPYAAIAAVGAFLAYKVFRVLAASCGTGAEFSENMRRKDKALSLGDILTLPLLVAFVLLAALVLASELKH